MTDYAYLNTGYVMTKEEFRRAILKDQARRTPNHNTIVPLDNKTEEIHLAVRESYERSKGVNR